MRLLNTDDLTFRDFLGEHTEPYAILSHCWSCTPGQDEPTYQQVIANTVDHDSYGWKKVEKCCAIARERGLQWAWIDTVCIDKTSSAELSEAINSMYAWYQGSVECYVLLDDIDGSPSLQARTAARQQFEQTFQRSRWFTRGWTLQELLAPSSVLFYDKDGYLVGSRIELAPMIARATGIHEDYITKKHPVTHASIAQRFSWASQRETTRPEDLSYSLLGLFQVNMPLLYGEGRKAFLRLQLAIIEVSDDDSIFAWGVPPFSDPNTGMFSLDIQEPVGFLALSPSEFSGSQDVVWDVDNFARRSKPRLRPTQKYIEYRKSVRPFILTWIAVLFNKQKSTNLRYAVGQSLCFMVLDCHINKDHRHYRIEIGLRIDFKDRNFYRVAFKAYEVIHTPLSVHQLVDVCGVKKTLTLATLPVKDTRAHRSDETLQKGQYYPIDKQRATTRAKSFLSMGSLAAIMLCLLLSDKVPYPVVIYLFIWLRDSSQLVFYIFLPPLLIPLSCMS